jgi:hypothetical protein
MEVHMPDRNDRGFDDGKERRPEEGWEDRVGAARRRLLDYEGGYGGGRSRAERWPEHGFGDRGWGGGRAPEGDPNISSDRRYRELPEGARPVSGGPGWDERYVRENFDKYGQSGGQPIRQRGAGQSMGGYEHEEAEHGSTRDIGARGGYGIRETDRWPRPESLSGKGRFTGKGPKNYRRCDDNICEEVCQRLSDDPDVDATDIEVSVRDGEVTLSGVVDGRSMKRAAEDCVENVSGVRDVHNEIRIRAAQPADARE